MDKQHIVSEGHGHRWRSSHNGRTSRRFTGKSLLPLTLAQPANHGVAPEVAKVPSFPTELAKGNLMVEAGKATKVESHLQEEKSTEPLQRRLSLNADQRIKHAQRGLANPLRDPVKTDQEWQRTRMRKRLRLEIEAYVTEVYLSEVYGDFLSGHRTRLYEPSWPPSSQSLGKCFESHCPKSQKEADAILQKILAPLLDWYALPESQADEKAAVEKQSKIAKALDRRERERGARECQQKGQGCHTLTLYRNVPDAGLEANILMLINRAHLAVQRGSLEHADRLIDKALGTVDRLDYRPLSAKCWYWKGLVADKRGSASEAAEAFFNALECVGKYAEGDYLPKYIQVYQQEILDMLQIDTESGKIEMARKLERAAKGNEPFHLPSPRPAQYEEIGLDLTPPRTPSPFDAETAGIDKQSPQGGQDRLPLLKESLKSDLRGLNINIPLPSPSDLSQIRRRRTSSTHISPQSPSTLKPLPAPRSSLPPEPAASPHSPEMPQLSRSISLHSSPTPSRPDSPYASLPLRARLQSRVLGVVGDIEWHETVRKQMVDREGKIRAMKEKRPDAPVRGIRNIVQTLDLVDLRKKFGDDILDPHADYWETTTSETPSPREKQYKATREESKIRLGRTYDYRDSAVKSRMAWRKKAEQEAIQAARAVSWDPDVVWSRDEETLRKEGWFDRLTPRTEEGDGEKRRLEERLTSGRVPSKVFLEALRHVHTPGEEDGGEKRQSLFMPHAEARPPLRQRPGTTYGPAPIRPQQSVSSEGADQSRSGAGSVDARGSEPPSPSPRPLRRSSVPGEGNEDTEEVGGTRDGAQPTGSTSETVVDEGVDEGVDNQPPATDETRRRSPIVKAPPRSSPNLSPEPNTSPNVSGLAQDRKSSAGSGVPSSPPSE